jgi:hypothetical protein
LPRTAKNLAKNFAKNLAKNFVDSPWQVPGQNFPTVTRQPDRPPCPNFIS